jgi:hypothetical protein
MNNEADSKFPKIKYTLLIKELDDGAVVYEPVKEICYSLNSTSAYIWSLCDGNNSVSDIIQAIKTDFIQFEIKPEAAVIDIIKDFQKNNLLENVIYE